MPVRFLADANRHQGIVSGILRCEPTVDFAAAHGMIPDGLNDLGVLEIAAASGRILVSHDVRTMPEYFSQFILRNNSPGLILVPTTMPLGRAIEELLLIWHLSEATEWTNLYRRLPL